MKRSYTLIVVAWCFVCALCHAVENTGQGLPFIFDMVHHNPGEPLYESRYNDPAILKEMGFNGKVYFLFDSPQLAIDWDVVDPDILPAGSDVEKWVEQKAARLHREYARCKEAGVDVYALSDLILFPKNLVEKYQMGKTFGDPRDPQTEKYLRILLQQSFAQFPELDGLVVRIGETYLEDAPYHKGKIQSKKDAEKTIIPLMKILRDEVCVKLNKKLVFRTWLSFDRDLEKYLAVSDAVEPHENLIIGVKHCEGDFHRGNDFSKIMGAGRHPQIIEVQCAREYEGKGAYPNYVAHGVIEGFEEHSDRPANQISSLRQFYEASDLFKGVWTWTRGGGWEGPYITDEFWCDLNAWVMAQWAKAPEKSEEEVFNRYAVERAGLKGDDVAKFRQLCLLSADAVLRGKRSTNPKDLSPWWTRDEYIGVPSIAGEGKNAAVNERMLSQRRQSVEMWEKMVALADDIHFPDNNTGAFVRTSTRYGLHLHRIFEAVTQLYLLDVTNGKVEEINKWLGEYDSAWSDFRQLKEEHPECSTLYQQEVARRMVKSPRSYSLVERMRKKVNN